MLRSLVTALVCGLCVSAQAASRNEMRDLTGLIVQHAGGEKDVMEVKIFYDGYSYRITLAKRDEGRQELVIEQTAEKINRATLGSAVEDLTVTLRYVDENTDGVLEDAIAKTSKSRYWNRQNAWKDNEQAKYDEVVKTLIRALKLQAPI